MNATRSTIRESDSKATARTFRYGKKVDFFASLSDFFRRQQPELYVFDMRQPRRSNVIAREIDYFRPPTRPEVPTQDSGNGLFHYLIWGSYIRKASRANSLPEANL
jgi:hypothetical protein